MQCRRSLSLRFHRRVLARRAGQERGTGQSPLARRRIDGAEQAGVESQIGADRASFVDQDGNENGGLASRDIDLDRAEDFTRRGRFRASDPLSLLMKDPFPRGGSASRIAASALSPAP